MDKLGAVMCTRQIKQSNKKPSHVVCAPQREALSLVYISDLWLTSMSCKCHCLMVSYQAKLLTLHYNDMNDQSQSLPEMTSEST